MCWDKRQANPDVDISQPGCKFTAAKLSSDENGQDRLETDAEVDDIIEDICDTDSDEVPIAVVDDIDVESECEKQVTYIKVEDITQHITQDVFLVIVNDCYVLHQNQTINVQ